jgi:hypothetical protein
MQEMWFSTHQNWYEGIANNTPTQNNALESYNLVIKKDDIFRERMPLSRFLRQCLETVEKWSKQYANNFIFLSDILFEQILLIYL